MLSGWVLCLLKLYQSAVALQLQDANANGECCATVCIFWQPRPPSAWPGPTQAVSSAHAPRPPPLSPFPPAPPVRPPLAARPPEPEDGAVVPRPHPRLAGLAEAGDVLVVQVEHAAHVVAEHADLGPVSGRAGG